MTAKVKPNILEKINQLTIFHSEAAESCENSIAIYAWSPILNAKDFDEVELAKHFESFAQKLNLTVVGRELRLGAFRFDAVAYDQFGTLIVVELKVVATKDTLAQLLIYPHAIRKYLTRNGVTDSKIRAMLITTHLDTNVAELAERLSIVEDVSIKICVGSKTSGLQLVEPQSAGDQVWDQSQKRQICDFRIINGRLAAN